MYKYEVEIDETVYKYKTAISSNNVNSYKYVLGLSIILINPNYKRISFEQIADKVIDIYFNNIIINGLVEQKNNNMIALKQIRDYIDENNIKSELNKTDKNLLIEKLIDNQKNGFFKYVLPCFTGAKKDEQGRYVYPLTGENEFFSYNIEEKEIILSDQFFDCLRREYFLLKFITIEEYSKYLEKRNNKDVKCVLNKLFNL